MDALGRTRKVLTTLGTREGRTRKVLTTLGTREESANYS